MCIYRAAFRIKELLHIRGLYSPWRGVSILEVSGIISITEIKKAQCASWCTNCPDSRIQFFRTWSPNMIPDWRSPFQKVAPICIATSCVPRAQLLTLMPGLGLLSPGDSPPPAPTFGEESREAAVTLNGQCGSDTGSGPSLGAPVVVPSLERLQDLSTTLSLSFLIWNGEHHHPPHGVDSERLNEIQHFSVNGHHSLVKNGLGNVNRIGRNLSSPSSPQSSFLPFTEHMWRALRCLICMWAFPGLRSMLASCRRWRTCVSERVGHLPNVTQLVRGRICTEITETAQTRGFHPRLYCNPPPQPEENFKMCRDEFSFLNNHTWAFYIKILGWPKSSFGFFHNILWTNPN